MHYRASNLYSICSNYFKRETSNPLKENVAHAQGMRVNMSILNVRKQQTLWYSNLAMENPPPFHRLSG